MTKAHKNLHTSVLRGKICFFVLIITCVLINPLFSQDTSNQAVRADSSKAMASDSVNAASDLTHPELRIIRRKFVHKDQLLVGTWMMVFVVFIIVSSKNWNPG
ncbi:MAG: hypothetical protein ABIA63_02955 [bacterium]